MSFLGLFDGELRKDAWFDAELQLPGWFDTEIINTQTGQPVLGLKYWNGSSWVPATMKRWDGAAWVAVTIQRWQGEGGGWQAI